ncbi:hypothetical protein GLOTRDRAFT_112496, partial [Gloeophyllum trabeum ATCC 11539]
PEVEVHGRVRRQALHAGRVLAPSLLLPLPLPLPLPIPIRILRILPPLHRERREPPSATAPARPGRARNSLRLPRARTGPNTKLIHPLPPAAAEQVAQPQPAARLDRLQ